MRTTWLFAALACCSSAVAQNTTFWSSSTVPSNVQSTDTAAVTMGLKFTSTVPGLIYGVRFYKGSGNTGTHVGNLWSATGAKLATVNFTNETATGWQQANFSKPYSVVANTVYVVSVYMPRGRYANHYLFPWGTINRPPLKVSGTAPGVFKYGTAPIFPTETWQSANYYVDVNFRETVVAPATFSISGTLTGVDEIVNLAGAAAGNETTESARAYTFLGLANGQYLITPVQEGFTFDPVSRSVTLAGASITGVNFVVTFKANPVPPPPPAPIVDMGWVASPSPGIIGHNVYRKVQGQSSFLKINNSMVTGTAYADLTGAAGSTYVYVVTALNSTDESGYSNEATISIP